MTVHVCGECGKNFNSEGGWKSHQQATGHRDPECYVCNRTFCSSAGLEQHKRDTGHKDPECKACGKTFTSKAALEQHKSATGHGSKKKTPPASDAIAHMTAGLAMMQLGGSSALLKRAAAAVAQGAVFEQTVTADGTIIRKIHEDVAPGQMGKGNVLEETIRRDGSRSYRVYPFGVGVAWS